MESRKRAHEKLRQQIILVLGLRVKRSPQTQKIRQHVWSQYLKSLRQNQPKR